MISEMFRTIALVFFLLTLTFSALGQDDLTKLVGAEHAFAQLAAERGTKEAFLANMTDDAVVYTPDITPAKPHWTSRPGGGPGLLSWAPNYADISSNGNIGYTTGNWEFRPKGKDDQPAGFGDFITIWVRQPDGKFKWVVDVGVGHSKPERYSTEWTTTNEKVRDINAKRTSAADASTGFLQMIKSGNVKKAYSSFAADDIRLYREDRMPFLGKKAALAAIAAEKGELHLAERNSFLGSADLAYNMSKYTREVDGKVIEKGNYVQIWKLKGGSWKLVLDIFKPVPENTK